MRFGMIEKRYCSILSVSLNIFVDIYGLIDLIYQDTGRTAEEGRQRPNGRGRTAEAERYRTAEAERYRTAEAERHRKDGICRTTWTKVTDEERHIASTIR